MAEPPTLEAGVRSVTVMDPGSEGVTAVTLMLTTFPSGSDALTAPATSARWVVVSSLGQEIETGSLTGGVPTLPRPSKVSTGKPSHCTDGSNGSVPSVSPTVTEAFRRSVLSRVLVRPVPHSSPGSNPIWPMMSMALPL